MKNFVVNTFYKQRQDFERDSALHDKKFSMPRDVKEWKDLPYKNDGEKANRMDVFRPKNREGETLPVIINVHGGGLLLGSKEFNRYYCVRLCELGYVVFSIEYRLVPDCQVYDQFTDVADAMTHIFQSLSKFQGDSEQIYVVADSGGAYLLTYVTAMTGCRPLAKAAHTTPPSFRLRALGLISGMFYTTRFDKIGLVLPRYLYGKHYKKTPFAPFTNAENKDLVSSLPPCFLVSSHNDNLEHYTLHFEKALSENHIPHKLVLFPQNKRLTHAFSLFDPFMKESTEAIMAMHQFFETV